MKITVRRIIGTENETLSLLSVDGDVICFSLEDQWQREKVADETRIPAGAYRVQLRTEGGIHPRYAAKFPEFHEGMLWLKDVPGFTYIYFHMGNTDDHTSGCILVGERGRISEHGRVTIQNSEVAYRRLYPRVVECAKLGTLSVEILDED